MTNTRLGDDDKHAMSKLTKAFGENFWEYAVFVLTFANQEDCDRRDERDADTGSEPDYNDLGAWNSLREDRFKGRLKKWKNELKSFLITEVGVSSEIASKIPVVPTGDHKKTPRNRQPNCLPDRDDWFNKFWEACCLRVKETQLFLGINKDRLVAEDDGVDEHESQEKTTIPKMKSDETHGMRLVSEKPKVKPKPVDETPEGRSPLSNVNNRERPLSTITQVGIRPVKEEKRPVSMYVGTKESQEKQVHVRFIYVP
jgi:hypothetical protein